MTKTQDMFDVLIIGAGPAGIAATVTLAEADRRVCIIDEAFFVGGQIWRNRGDIPKDKQARHWLDRLTVLNDRIVRLHQSRVIANPGSNTLLVETPDGPRRLEWTSLVLATGARELFLPFPGWTLPNVVGAGGLQALVKQGLPVQGKRIVVAGSGPLLLAVADLMKSLGAVVPVILEQTPAARLGRFALSLVRTPAKLFAGAALRGRLLGTRYAAGSYPTAVTTEGSGLSVRYVCGRATASEHCDYLACGFGLVPNNEIAQLIGCELDADGFVRVDEQQRTTMPGVYAIGELTGIGGVDKALVEGRLAAYSIVSDKASAARLTPEYAAARAFTRRLDSAFALRHELFQLADGDTIVCRCEDVKMSSVRNCFSGRDAKLQTRCGMGVCQGRVCGAALQRILGMEAPQVRPPVFATAIGTLANAQSSNLQIPSENKP